MQSEGRKNIKGCVVCDCVLTRDMRSHALTSTCIHHRVESPPGTDSSSPVFSDTCGTCAFYSTCVSATGSGPYDGLASVPWAAANNWCPPYTYATRSMVGRCWPSENSYSNSSVSASPQIQAAAMAKSNTVGESRSIHFFSLSL